mgnify:FL=1
MVYLITYDLNSEGQKYEDVIATIQDVSNGNYCSYWKSSYLFSSNLTDEQILDRLEPCIDTNDSLIIIKVDGEIKGWFSSTQKEKIISITNQ